MKALSAPATRSPCSSVTAAVRRHRGMAPTMFCRVNGNALTRTPSASKIALPYGRGGSTCPAQGRRRLAVNPPLGQVLPKPERRPAPDKQLALQVRRRQSERTLA